jgi:glutamate/tyrosine decarboxylase-like PLP-dependent enzyme
MQPALAGMEQADSLAFDLHKWMSIPYEAGCTLVRSEEIHRRAFSLTPDYLVHAEGGVAGGSRWFSEYGLQLSRSFRSLKIWMSLKEHGIERYSRMIQKNIDQARYLAERVRQSPNLELLAPVPLNIVCFRYTDSRLSNAALNELNARLLIQLQELGVAVPSSTTIAGTFAIRVANVNHRSLRQDFDVLVEAVVRLGKDLAERYLEEGKL